MRTAAVLAALLGHRAANSAPRSAFPTGSEARAAAAFEAMACTDGAGYGMDGQCNEANRAQASQCVPATDGFLLAPGASVTGTRDSYNARDIEQMISGSQTNAMTINCVDGAAD